MLKPSDFIIRVNEFNQVATTPLEEWLDYLKNGHIKDDTQAPGLQEAREKLQYMMLDKAARYAYDEHINAVMIQNDVLGNMRAEGREEGRAEGRAEGREEGREEERQSIAKKLKVMGMSAADIAKATGLSQEEIAAI